jgi:hypothetical protein
VRVILGLGDPAPFLESVLNAVLLLVVALGEADKSGVIVGEELCAMKVLENLGEEELVGSDNCLGK